MLKKVSVNYPNTFTQDHTTRYIKIKISSNLIAEFLKTNLN